MASFPNLVLTSEMKMEALLTVRIRLPETQSGRFYSHKKLKDRPGLPGIPQNDWMAHIPISISIHYGQDPVGRTLVNHSTIVEMKGPTKQLNSKFSPKTEEKEYIHFSLTGI